jgi:hypothetical protein
MKIYSIYRSGIIAAVLICFLSSLFSCATTLPPQNTMPDSTSLPPNTIRATANVTNADDTHFTITILEVKEQGQGIINILSEGESVRLAIEKGKAGKWKGKKLEVLLREKIGIDASQSTYVLISYHEL